MVRVLQVIGSLERAGAETFLMNLYRNIDRDRIQFDFAIYEKPSGNSYYDEVVSMGARVFMLPDKSSGILRNLKEIAGVVRAGRYQAVWRHADSCVGGLDLLAAGRGGAGRLILHSHSSDTVGVGRVLHYLLRHYVNKRVTDRFSCSEAAGKWMFLKNNYKVIRNGIDTKQFQHDKGTEAEFREKYRLDNRPVVGHVGRFHPVKNQRFIIDVFGELLKMIPDVMLVFVGTGEQEREIREITRSRNLEGRVLFLGSRSDVAGLYQMMDVFVMPSLYEGFPVTLLEAQAAGLPCVISDTITREVDVTGNVEFLGLDVPRGEWAARVAANIGKKDGNAAHKVRQAGYDIKDIAGEIQQYIMGLAGVSGHKCSIRS